MPDFSDKDQQWMKHALALAERGSYTCDPNPRVGCVLVKDGGLLAEGWHQVDGEAHAEKMALNECDLSPRGATAYVTLEPCAHPGRTGSCAAALIDAGISNVVIATHDPYPQVDGRGISQLESAGVNCRTGLLESQANHINRGFFKRVRTGLPFVTVKIASSLDGAIALHNGQSQWITNEMARQDVHRLRAASSAVLTGIGTVLADNPRMNARLEEGTGIKQPLRVVLDSQLRLPLDSVISGESPLVFTAIGSNAGDRPFEVIEIEKSAADQLDLSQVLAELGRRKVNHLLVEAGPKVSGSFIRSGLADELVIYQAPKLMGAQARGMLELGKIESMNDVIELVQIDETAFGNCSRKTFQVNK